MIVDLTNAERIVLLRFAKDRLTQVRNKGGTIHKYESTHKLVEKLKVGRGLERKRNPML